MLRLLQYLLQSTACCQSMVTVVQILPNIPLSVIQSVTTTINYYIYYILFIQTSQYIESRQRQASKQGLSWFCKDFGSVERSWCWMSEGQCCGFKVAKQNPNAEYAVTLLKDYVIKAEQIINDMAQIFQLSYDLQIIQDSQPMKSTTVQNYTQSHQQMYSAFEYQYFDHPKSILSINTEIDFHQHLFYLDEDFFPHYQSQHIAQLKNSNRQDRDVQQPIFQYSQEENLEMQIDQIESSKQNSDVPQLKIQKDQSQEKQIKDFNCNNETKNVPKNYIKAIFAFALQNQQIMVKMMKQVDVRGDFFEFVRTERKVKCYTIERLKRLWKNDVFGGMMRVLSNYFLRRRCYSYIFGSKIATKGVHLKYRFRLMNGVRDPTSFNNIK